MYPLHDVEKSISRMYEFHDLYNKEGLYPHQEFVRRFMSPHTPYKSILLYHSPGSGKSMICISIAIDHYKESSMKSLVVTKGESSSDSFKRQIEQYMAMSNEDIRISSIFHFDHYISLHNRITKCKDHDIVNFFDNKVIIFDEVHNIREFETKLQSPFNSLLRLKNLCKNSKILLSTATPMVDNSGQMESIDKLVSTEIGSFVSFNSRVQKRPRARFMGKKDNDHIIEKLEVCYMIGHQKAEYELESKNEIKDIYKKLIDIALFYCPGREDILEFVKEEKKPISPLGRNKSSKEISFLKFSVKSEYTRYTYGTGLRESSCKYYKLMENIRRSKGNIFISIEEIRGPGLLLLASILEIYGYELYYGQSVDPSIKKSRYTICVGSSDICPNMQDRLEAFNSPLNVDGSYVKILLGSRVMGESVTLLNVRQFHSLSPHWNYSKLTQAIGRVIRSNSHSMLRERDREVEIYIYAASGTVDMSKISICKKKQVFIEIEEESLKSKSIERYIDSRRGKDYNWNTDNFLLYYSDRYRDLILSQVRKVFSKRSEVSFEDICSTLDFPRIVVLDALFKITSDNCEILNSKFLREDEGNFFLVDDPSLPLQKLRPHIRDIEEEDITPIKDVDVNLYFRTKEDALKFLRTKNVREKMELLEEILRLETRTKSQKMILDLLTYLHINAMYHILGYRELSNSYKAVLPFPNRLSGKTRKLENNRWVDLEDLEKEKFVLSKMEERYRLRARNIGSTYAIISVIDNRMRLRRGEEMEDRRRTPKGRDIQSIRKDDLLEIASSIGLDCDEFSKTKDIVREIENVYITSGKYIFV